MECLLDHQQEISDGCYDSLKARMARVTASGTAGNNDAGPAAAMMACKQDGRALCGDVQPGGGRVVRCLAEHRQSLSQPCYEALSHLDKGRSVRQGQ